MNNKQLIINSVFVALIGVLFFMQINCKSCPNDIAAKNHNTENKEEKIIRELPEGNLKVAFINNDTLSAKYEYYLQVTAELKSKEMELRARMEKMAGEYKKAEDKLKADQAIIGETEMQRRYEELMMMQQSIYQKNEEMNQQFMQLEASKTQDYMKNSYEFIQIVGKEMGYDYIFSQSFGGTVLYGNPALDITHEVVVRLNEIYKDRQTAK